MLGAAPVSLSKGIVVGAADGIVAVVVGIVDAAVSAVAVVSVVIVIMRKIS
jgi:hypothetical protein